MDAMVDRTKRRLHGSIVYTKSVHIRLTVNQYLALNDLALIDTLAMTSVIRLAINDYLRKRNAYR
jgi:hypothetical protein